MPRIHIKEADVKAIFETATEQADYIVGIYKLVFPDWDAIDKIKGWPSINEHTWKAICRMAMDWDKLHTDCLAGGAWMNSGFSSLHGKDLPNWAVSMKEVVVVMNEVAA